MPDWAVFVVVAVVGFACLAALAQSAGRDAARTVAAAYWVGQGDMERARRALRGERN